MRRGRGPDPRRRRGAAITAFLAAAVGFAGAPGTAAAWGFAAHRMVNGKAIATLPEPLKALFAGNRAYLVEHSIDPDLWRAAGKPNEGPNHFLDLDAFGAFPFPDLPRDEAGHLAKHGAEAVEKGRVPWRVGEAYRDLVAAFRARDEAKALEIAAVLGHYVGDAHVPLHAVVNYDGQVTGQTGLHARWESVMFERFERQVDALVLPSVARHVDDPVALVFDALLESFARSPEGFAADSAVAGPRDYADTPEDDRYGSAYYSALFEREGETLAARLASAATAVGSLWLSAWEDAGRPALDASFRFPYVRGLGRAILVSIDGAAAPVIADAVRRGVMPNLARLRAAGATARGATTSLPAKTAAGHAALFTGTWPDQNGVTGNSIAPPDGSILETVSGYRSDALRAEPIWVTAARQGLDVTLLSAAQDFPYAAYQEEKRFGGSFGRTLSILDGYKGSTVDDAVYGPGDLALRPAAGWSSDLGVAGGREFSLDVAGSRVEGLLFDDPADPTPGLDTLLLSLKKDGKGGVRLKPRPVRPDAEAFSGLSVPAPGGELGVFFRLFELSGDGARIVLYRAKAGAFMSNKAPLASAATRATGGFVGNGASGLYEKGAFGPPLWAGGAGAAEARYLETVRLSARQFARLAEFGVNRTRHDLLIAYLPFPDEAFHCWLGHLDPTVPGYDAKLAARVQKVQDEMLGIVDGFLGVLADAARNDDAVLAVASDHGQVAVYRRVRLNVALERAGLLGLDAEGHVDLSRTRALYFSDSGYFLLNRASRKGGIVRPEDEAPTLDEVQAVLTALRDPETGRAVVTEVLDPRTRGTDLGIGGPQGGDLYFSLARGYYPSAETRGPLFESRRPTGEHLLDPARPEMQAAFAVAGPGVAAGVDLGVVREIDIAPTLCALLGIDPPAHAAGRVLAKALLRPLVDASRPRAGH